MRFLSFGSGSSGNAFLLDTGESRIMFDCGIGIRRLRRELTALDVAGKLDAVVLTHEHIDHVRALASLMRYEQCPVFASAGTFDAIGRNIGWQPARPGIAMSVAGISITPINVLHDASEPFGYFIEASSERIALFTDLGAPQSEVTGAISASTTVVLESNYCESMLRTSGYPNHLKRRIRSQHGHLSNDDCAATLVEALRPTARKVWLAHLSENNNAPVVAEATVQEALSLRGIGLSARSLPRHDTIDLLTPSPDPGSWQSPLVI